LKKITIPIKGMHCKACALLIEEKLYEFNEIKKVRVSFNKKDAEIYAVAEVDILRIKAAVRQSGYDVGFDETRPWFSKNPVDYRDLLIAASLVIALYFIIRATGISNIGSTGQATPSNLFIVFTVGLTAGISTCMALVGGLILSISSRYSEKHPEAKALQKFKPHLFFNIGRIASYFILGGAVGALGKVFHLSGRILGVLIIIVGLVMFFLGIQITEIFPRLSGISFSLPESVGRFFHLKKRQENEYSNMNSIFAGALTFFLPCGFTQAMQLFAMSTGSFLSGAIIMAVFAIGTTPGLLSIGGITSLVKGSFAKKFFKFAGIVVILFALLNISSGYNLTGWNIFQTFKGKSVSIEAADPNVVLENGVQIVRMVQVSNGYKPDKFIIKKGIPVKWIIDSKSSNSCASSIVVPDLEIFKNLSPGENIIEFTAQNTGELKFSCAMGMYTGKFIVVDDRT
jgi:uncharacterized protein